MSELQPATHAVATTASSRARAALVWAGVSVACGLLAWLLLPLPAATGGFDGLLVQACTLALLACAAWFWAVTTVVVLSALRAGGRPLPHAAPRGVPAPVRRLVLAACGVALSTPVATPALATPGPATDVPDHSGRVVLTDLPFPERATDPDPAPTPAGTGATVTVRAGDSLWSITEEQVGTASPDRVAREWRALHDANRDRIDDPDLIHPGQQLRLPESWQ